MILFYNQLVMRLSMYGIFVKPWMAIVLLALGILWTLTITIMFDRRK